MREKMKRNYRGALLGGLALALTLMLSGPYMLNAGEGATLKPGSRDKCPVCGMFVAPYPNWLAAVVFTDGSRLYFDGPKDLFKYLFDRKKYDARGLSREITSILVTDYYGAAAIDAKTARYVTGSDVTGPMGRELVPVAKEEDAKTFLTDHKGTKILLFPEITPEIVKALDHGHGH